MAVEFLEPSNNVAIQRRVPYINQDVANNYLYGDNTGRRNVNPDLLCYGDVTGEIVGARRISVRKTLEDGTIVVAEFTEHGAQLCSLTHTTNGVTRNVFHQGTFARYNGASTWHPNDRAIDTARGYEPHMWDGVGRDPSLLEYEGERHSTSRMHGEAETSLFTLDIGFSDFDNGTVVLSIKGEEMTGLIKNREIGMFVIHQLEDDGSVTTSVVVHNFSKQTIVATPGFHPYHQRQYVGDAPNPENALANVLINGNTLVAADLDLLLDHGTIQIPTPNALEYDDEGNIKGLRFQFYDDVNMEGIITALTGFMGRDAEVWIWTDRANQYVCIEFTYSGERTGNDDARDRIVLRPGDEVHYAINRRFWFGSD